MQRKRDELSPAAGLLLLLATWLLLRFALVGLLIAFPEARTDIVSLGVIEALVLGGASLWLSFPLATPESSSPGARPIVNWSVQGAGGASAVTVLLGVMLGMALKPPADTLRAFVERAMPTPEAELLAKMELLHADTVAGAVALLLVIGLVGPLVEEFFFRGALFERLRRGSSVAWASTLTCVGFAFAHESMRDWPSLMVVGLALTVLRVATGSLWPCVALHVSFNCATLLELIAGYRTDPSVPAALGGTFVVVGLLVLAPRITRLGST